jgi:hypothetical protein
MYSKMNKYIKDFIQTTVTAETIQTGYIGDFPQLDLRKSAILLEPRTDQKEAKDLRWKQSTYSIKIWIMVAIVMDYETSMLEVEKILGAEDDEAGEVVGLYAALDQLKKDPVFAQMSGSFGGKQWRVKSGRPLTYSNVGFGITQTSSSKINTATLDLTVEFDQEK